MIYPKFSTLSTLFSLFTLFNMFQCRSVHHSTHHSHISHSRPVYVSISSPIVTTILSYEILNNFQYSIYYNLKNEDIINYNETYVVEFYIQNINYDNKMYDCLWYNISQFNNENKIVYINNNNIKHYTNYSNLTPEDYNMLQYMEYHYCRVVNEPYNYILDVAFIIFILIIILICCFFVFANPKNIGMY